MPKKYKVLLKLLFVLLVIYVISRSIDVPEAGRLLSRISIPFFLMTFLVCTLDQIFMGFKWNLLLKAFGVSRPATLPVLIYLRGRAIHMITPSVLGIDAYKVWCVRQTGAPLAPTVSSILVERMVGVLSSLAAVSLFAYFAFTFLKLPYAWAGALAGFLSFGLICIGLMVSLRKAHTISRFWLPSILPKKLQLKLRNGLVALSAIGKSAKYVWWYFGLSIIEKLFYGTAVYLAALTVGLEGLSYAGIVATTPLLALLERVPISIAAIGVREGLFVLLLRPFTTDVTLAITVALVLRLAELIMMLLSLVLWFGDSESTRFVEGETTIPSMEELVVTDKVSTE